MSVKIMAMVWDKSPASGSELLCLLAMADWANDQGGSLHPSVLTLAHKIRISESQTRRILHKFIEQGFLSVVGNAQGGKPGASRRYQINVPKLLALPDIAETGSVDAHEPSETGSMDAHESAETGSVDARDGSHGCARRVAPMTPKPPRTTIEPPIKKRARMANDAIADVPEWIDRATYDAFMEMRLKIKKPMTENAILLMINELERMHIAGQDIKAVLQKSIMNSWAGVFEIKTEKRHGGSRNPSRMAVAPEFERNKFQYTAEAPLPESDQIKF